MRKSFFQLHLAIFLAGFTGILGKLISLNEGLLVWYRLLFSAVTMWILFTAMKLIRRISFADILRITGVGLVAALHWVLFFGSIKYANVSVALVCFSSIGFFTAFLEPLLTHRRLIPLEVFLGLLVMLGIYIIFHFDPSFKTGILLGIGSAMLGSLFPIFNRQLMQRMNAETLITWELSGGWLTLSFLLPFYLHYFPVHQIWPSRTDLLWLLLLAWACSVWAFRLSANALKEISAFTVNLSYNLEPVYGILLAFLFFREDQYMSTSFYAGLGIILTSVLFQSWWIYRKYGAR